MPDPPQSPTQLRRPAPALVALLAAVGSIGGLAAAVAENSLYAMRSLTAGLLVVLVAPAIEEICKPIALVFLLDKRPHWLRGSVEIVVLAALSALIFATLENLYYIYLIAPGRGMGFVLWRLTICTGMHVCATTIFGLGLAKMWRHIGAHGGHFDIDVCFRYYVSAVAVHAGYNSLVLVLAVTGVLSF